MTEKPANVVYIISGPCGVGKSTTARELANILNNAALIEGDSVDSMLIGKEELAWEERLSLTWNNILSLTRNFVQNEVSVVIDYVVETELEWFCENVSDLHAQIRYVVLTAAEDSLIHRLNQRGSGELIERSLFLKNQLENCALNRRYLYDTTSKPTSEIVKEIINRPDDDQYPFVH